MKRLRDAAHTGPHGIGQKASDLECVPLCRPCHQELHRLGPEEFQKKRKIGFAELARMFRRFYRLKFGTPDWWPDQPAITFFTCACGFEDFSEEFAQGCPECGRREEKAA